MFIGITFEFISSETLQAVDDLLKQYGIKKVYSNVYESFNFPAAKLGNLKRALTDNMDMDDKLRIYQYPVDNVMKISYIVNRKWKRLSFKM